MVSHLNFTDIATIPRWLEMSRNQIPYLLHVCFRTILTLSAFHIGRKVALDAQAAALVYIRARLSQIAKTHKLLRDRREGLSAVENGAKHETTQIEVIDGTAKTPGKCVDYLASMRLVG